MARSSSEELASAIDELHLNIKSPSEVRLKSAIDNLNRYRKVIVQVGIRKHWKMSYVVNILTLKDEDKIVENDAEVPISEIHKMLCELDLPNTIEEAWKSVLQYLLVSLSEAKSELDADAVYRDYSVIKECLIYYLNNPEVFFLKSKINNLVGELLENFAVMLRENDNFTIFKSKIHVVSLTKMMIVELGKQPGLIARVSAAVSNEIIKFGQFFIEPKDDEVQIPHNIHFQDFITYLEIMKDLLCNGWFYSSKSNNNQTFAVELQQILMKMKSCKNVTFTAKFFIGRILMALA